MPTPKQQLGKIITELTGELFKNEMDWDRIREKGIDLELLAYAGKGEADAVKDMAG